MKLVNESEDALSRKIKEVREMRDKLQKSDEDNHKLIVESQVLKRELLDIKESSTKDKHVSISHEERHKRERESLLKEIECVKAEGKKTREDFKNRAAAFDAERKELQKEVAEVRAEAAKDVASLKDMHRAEVEAVASQKESKITALEVTVHNDLFSAV